MTTMYASTSTPRLRPLAAALATLYAASTIVWALPLSHAAAPVPPIVVANCNDSGTGSLRAALSSAVSDDIIDLGQLNCSTITLTTGALEFGQSNLTIVGPGRNKLAIDGNNLWPVLYHTGDGALSVEELSIIGGNMYRSDVDAAGACVHANNNVLLKNVSIGGCKTSCGGSNTNRSAHGGAVWAHGHATIVHSTISDSSAIAHNSRDAGGGGLFVLGGLDMRGSTISGNVASSSSEPYSFGGGVVVVGYTKIVESEISGNQADYFGGLDVENHGPTAGLFNSTVSGNKAKVVGGVFAIPRIGLYNSTIAFNTSSVWIGNLGQHYAAGIHIAGAGQMQMHSSIVSNNFNSGAPGPTADVSGTSQPVFAGSNNNAMSCDIPCPPDTTNDDPGLHPLQDNGGPTRTHMPTPGLWDRLGGSNFFSLEFDQRGPGFPRISAGDPIEIGAYQTNSDIVFVNGFN